MEAIIAHFQEYYPYYVFGAIVLAPLIFFTRKYSLPALLFAGEGVLYSAVMHVVVWCIVSAATWFKNASTMNALKEDGKPQEEAFWKTPFIEFWNKDLYDPTWVIYMEGVFVLLILYAIIRYRPMKVHNPHKRRFDDAGKAITKGGRPGYGKTYGKGGAARGGRH